MDFVIALSMYIVEGFLQHPIAFTLWATALYFNLKHI